MFCFHVLLGKMETVMANTQFDPRVEVGGVNLFRGDVTRIGMRQNPALPTHVSNRLINPDEPFYIEIEWNVSGAEAPLRMNAVGDWAVFAYAESMGPGPEVSLKPYDTVPKGAVGAGGASWHHTIEVPANVLTEHYENGDSGVYKLVVVIAANSNLPGPGDDVIGYAELPFLIGAENPA